ncbi:MAG TPA: metal-sulfur cluster assembly factor [Gemmatimonadaceae bacterium]|nr:metal-sulfur cluster assembly factor [Gemmatimonadaceae bacterium]
MNIEQEQQRPQAIESRASQPQSKQQQEPSQNQAADAPPSPAAPNEAAASTADVVSEDQVKAVLRRVKDPELNLNIVDLGLVYGVAVEGSTVRVDMSLTSPGCPSGPEIMGDAERQLRSVPGVTDVAMNLVWSPIWTPERIEPRVRAYLGF